VLLMDEIEKAHPDIFNILLQVMDHGTLTDNNGRKSDFRNVTLIMTTNAGADQLAKSNIGFTSHKEAGDEMGEIKRMFTPEFRNRLDAVISFSTLDHEVILKVVDKFLLELENQLHERKVDASFTPNLKAFLAKKGFDPHMGARPMARLIQDTDSHSAGRRIAVRQVGRWRPGHHRHRPRRQGPSGVRGKQGSRTGRVRSRVRYDLLSSSSKATAPDGAVGFLVYRISRI
jgi:hypothetical protein